MPIWGIRCIYTYMDEQELLAQCAEVAEQCACFNLRRAARAVTHSYDAVLRSSGLRITQFTVLVGVSLIREAPLNVLADLLGLDRTTLTRNLTALEERRLITVTPGADRRTRLVSLSPDGQRAVSEALPLWRKAQKETIDAFGTERWTQMMPELARMSYAARAG